MLEIGIMNSYSYAKTNQLLVWIYLEGASAPRFPPKVPLPLLRARNKKKRRKTRGQTDVTLANLIKRFEFVVDHFDA